MVHCNHQYVIHSTSVIVTIQSKKFLIQALESVTKWYVDINKQRLYRNKSNWTQNSFIFLRTGACEPIDYFLFYLLWLSVVYCHYDVISLLMNTTNQIKLKTEPEEVYNTMDRFVLHVFGPKIWVEKLTELVLARWQWVKSYAMGCKVVPRIQTIFDIGAVLGPGLGHACKCRFTLGCFWRSGGKWGWKLILSDMLLLLMHIITHIMIYYVQHIWLWG